MPTPPQLPPQQPQASELRINNENNNNPYNVQYVTPNKSNLDQKQSQASNSNAKGVSNVENSPRFYDSGTNVYSQINSGYGENAHVYIEGVGRKTVSHIDLQVYYNRADIGGGYNDNNAVANNMGVQGRLMIPLGGKASKTFNELAEAKKTSVQLEQIQAGTDIDDQIVARCAKMYKSGVRIDYDNASPVLRKVARECQGFNMIAQRQQIQQEPDINQQLIQENQLLRQKLQQLSNTGVRQQVDN